MTVQNQEEQTPVEVAPGLRRRTTEFTLRGVTLEQLTRFLAAVEGKPGRVVLTQRMLIRSSSSTEDRINAEIELSTWERVAAEETP